MLFKFNVNCTTGCIISLRVSNICIKMQKAEHRPAMKEMPESFNILIKPQGRRGQGLLADLHFIRCY